MCQSLDWKKQTFFGCSDRVKNSVRYVEFCILGGALFASAVWLLLFGLILSKKSSDKIQCDVSRKGIESQDKCGDFSVRSKVQVARIHSENVPWTMQKWWNEPSRLLMGYRWIRFIYLFIFFFYPHKSNYSRRENAFHVTHICCRCFCLCTHFFVRLSSSPDPLWLAKMILWMFLQQKNNFHSFSHFGWVLI